MAKNGAPTKKRRGIAKSQQKYEVARPFRLWDRNEKRDIPHRNYSDSNRAEDSALRLVRWDIVNHVEVHDLNGERHIATYRSLPSGIWFKVRNGKWTQ